MHLVLWPQRLPGSSGGALSSFLYPFSDYFLLTCYPMSHTRL